jgi:hypothetical protein
VLLSWNQFTVLQENLFVGPNEVILGLSLLFMNLRGISGKTKKRKAESDPNGTRNKSSCRMRQLKKKASDEDTLQGIQEEIQEESHCWKTGSCSMILGGLTNPSLTDFKIRCQQLIKTAFSTSMRSIFIKQKLGWWFWWYVFGWWGLWWSLRLRWLWWVSCGGWAS